MATTTVSLPIATYDSIIDPDWCPGCGDYGVVKGFKIGAASFGVEPENLCTVCGIWC